MEIGFKTNKGRVRTHNEDACYIIPEKKIFIAADGVGGNSGGEVASRTAVYEISQYINENSLMDDASAVEVRDYLDKAIQRANIAIKNKADQENVVNGMATTLVMCCINGDSVYFGHVGDSRAYMIRQGKITQITKDHTYVNALIEAGIITEEEALTHEKRHMITKALGAEDIVNPDYEQVAFKEGDVIILCTDGLYGEISDSMIATVASDSSNSIKDICNGLVDMANEAGGKDNITVVCIRL